MPSLRKKSDLYAYQVFIAKRTKKLKFLLLAIPMGMGKTAAVLTAVRKLLDEFRVRCVLIVAPKYVAEYTWPDEIAEWEHLQVLNYSIIIGTAKQRLAALNTPAEIYMINRENLRWLWETLGPEEFSKRFDMIVYDESSRLKSGTKRVKAKKLPTGKRKRGRLSEYGVICLMRQCVRRFVELSGTPAPNGLIDLWGQIFVLDQGERLGATKKVFLDRWFVSDYMGYKWEPKEYAHKQIMKRLSDIMFSLRSEDHLDIPPVINNVIRIQLPKKIHKEYKRFARTLVSEAYDVEAASKGVLTNKLLQFCNGGLYRDIEGTYPVEKETVRVHDLKLDALESIMEEAAGAPVLVAYSFKFDRDRILKRFKYAVTPDRDKNWKRKWDKGKVRMLLVHAQSVGHGLNLQKGGYIACWFGLPWSLEVYQQFNKRLARNGQLNNFVMIHHIITADTVEDMDVLPALQDKAATQDKITEAVRVRIIQGA